MEVKTIGEEGVAAALREAPLWTVIEVFGSNLTMAPGAIVSVKPAGTTTGPSTTLTAPAAQVSLDVNVPE